MARRVLHDRFFKQAKAEGYLARSAYKLAEIDDAKRLLRRGMLVLDLGCAPGAWLQVASERVGPEGVVAGIDLKPVSPNIGANVRAITGDVYEATPHDLRALVDGRQFDVVLSDMAPNTSGHGDHFLSIRLCDRVLDLAAGPTPEQSILRPGGDLVMKVFDGETFPELLNRCRRMFANVKGFKPKASRDASREIYIVATHLKG